MTGVQTCALPISVQDFSISNGAELPEILDSLIQHPAIAETAGQKALEYVNSQLGATAVISKALSTTI